MAFLGTLTRDMLFRALEAGMRANLAVGAFTLE